MSPTITIPKIKYEALKEKARAYETLRRTMVRGGFFMPPSTKNASEVIAAFRKSGRYSKKFIVHVKQGLQRSDYFSGA